MRIKIIEQESSGFNGNLEEYDLFEYRVNECLKNLVLNETQVQILVKDERFYAIIKIN